MPEDTATLFGSAYVIERSGDREMIDISLRLTRDQAERIEREAAEATNLQEGIRMLLEEGIREREQQMRPEDYTRAFGEALEGIEVLLAQIIEERE